MKVKGLQEFVKDTRKEKTETYKERNNENENKAFYENDVYENEDKSFDVNDIAENYIIVDDTEHEIVHDSSSTYFEGETVIKTEDNIEVVNNSSAMIPCKASYIPGRSGSRMLLDPDGFLMSYETKNYNRRFYVCKEKKRMNCKVRASVDDKSDMIVRQNGEVHNHQNKFPDTFTTTFTKNSNKNRTDTDQGIDKDSADVNSPDSEGDALKELILNNLLAKSTSSSFHPSKASYTMGRGGSRRLLDPDGFEMAYIKENKNRRHYECVEHKKMDCKVRVSVDNRLDMIVRHNRMIHTHDNRRQDMNIID